MNLMIKELRLKNKLTQKELARRIHISRGYLSKIESNNPRILNGVRLGILINISKVLNVPIYELIKNFKEVKNEYKK